MPTQQPKADPDQLINAFRSYSKAIASGVLRKLPPSVDKDDIFGAAELGLVEAARTFDASRGVLFKTFAFYRIRGAIYDGLRKMAWFSKAQYQQYKFERAANEYLSDYASSPAPEGPAEEEVEELQNIASSVVNCYMLSFDQLQIEVAGGGQGSEEELVRMETLQSIKTCVAALPEKNRQVIELYYSHDMNMDEIGKKLGLSKSRICRIHSKSLEMLKDAMEGKS
jgi:RNA polymerase sigma factor FliA